MAETELFVIDDQGRCCEPNEPGELVHAGPTVALGYWKDAEATAEVFRPHPFKQAERVVFSGDIVTYDEDGLLTFVGRRDAMIKSLGVRVSPDEVEEILYDSGLVTEVVVRGIPDASSGSAVRAHVVPRDPNGFSDKELLAWCRREMPRYMIPAEIRVHEALPRTATGKIDRKAIA